jgi:hypothetical protein
MTTTNLLMNFQSRHIMNQGHKSDGCYGTKGLSLVSAQEYDTVATIPQRFPFGRNSSGTIRHASERRAPTKHLLKMGRRTDSLAFFLSFYLDFTMILTDYVNAWGASGKPSLGSLIGPCA